jgi:hypothetical protein
MKSFNQFISLLICSFIAISIQNSMAQTVTTLPATNITSTSATMNGMINPKGNMGGGFFMPSAKQVSPLILSGSSNINVSVNLTNLFPNTEYSYYLTFLKTSGSSVDGQVVKFTTYSTSINDDSKLSEINIYPNPATNVVYINSSIKVEKVEILNLLGKIILLQKIDQNSNSEINISGFSRGVYLIKITADNKSVIKTLMVQ